MDEGSMEIGSTRYAVFLNTMSKPQYVYTTSFSRVSLLTFYTEMGEISLSCRTIRGSVSGYNVIYILHIIRNVSIIIIIKTFINESAY